ncbi:MAG: hypothetical protein JO126_05380 [Alphaproteobacteria bacterium]|nr:hypothetical protein [Alphaproteobacteria bacterium]MBV8548868.1 hypothetical protein [Alphaproteobacteria bacterium]
MDRLKNALEALDEAISDLEEQVGIDNRARREAAQKQNELLKLSRSREAQVLATAQKVASRLDQAIGSVEGILRH